MSDDIVLVTGASSDIGVELVRTLAAGPMLVLAHGNSNVDRLRHLAESAPSKIVPLQADLRDTRAIAELLDAVERHGTPRGFVHLPAAPLALERFTEQSWDDLLADLELQLRSAHCVLQRLLPKMQALRTANGPRSKIVFVLSTVTCGLPPASMSRYVIVKHAMLGLMRALAAEYADKGVSVNAVSPSMVDTKFLAATPHKLAEIAAAKSPLKRNAQPSDIVPAIRFLLSSESDYMTGVNLPIAAGTAV